MGGLTAVHQFCRIGRFASTGGCSKIVQDVPPFLIADGNPAEIRGINLVGMEGTGFAPEGRKALGEPFRLLPRSKLTPGRRSKRCARESNDARRSANCSSS